MSIVTVFNIMRGTIWVDSFTTQQWKTTELALEKARAKRDQLNAASGVLSGNLEPCRIVRGWRRNTAKPL